MPRTRKHYKNNRTVGKIHKKLSPTYSKKSHFGLGHFATSVATALALFNNTCASVFSPFQYENTTCEEPKIFTFNLTLNKTLGYHNRTELPGRTNREQIQEALKTSSKSLNNLICSFRAIEDKFNIPKSNITEINIKQLNSTSFDKDADKINRWISEIIKTANACADRLNTIYQATSLSGLINPNLESTELRLNDTKNETVTTDQNYDSTLKKFFDEAQSKLGKTSQIISNVLRLPYQVALNKETTLSQVACTNFTKQLVSNATKAMNESLSQTKYELQQALQQAEVACNDSSIAVGQYGPKIGKLQEKLNNFIVKTTALEKKLNNVKKQVDFQQLNFNNTSTLKTNITQLERNINRLNGAIVDYQNQTTDIKTALSEIQNGLTNLQYNMTQLSNETQKLEATDNQLATNISLLQDELLNMTNKFTSLTQMGNRTNDRLENTSRILNQTQTERKISDRSLTRINKTLIKQHEEIKESLANITALYTSKSDKVDLMQQQLRNFSESEAAQLTTKQVTNMVDEAINKKYSNVDKVQNLGAKIETITQKYNSTLVEQQDIIKDINQLRKEIADLSDVVGKDQYLQLRDILSGLSIFVLLANAKGVFDTGMIVARYLKNAFSRFTCFTSKPTNSIEELKAQLYKQIGDLYPIINKLHQNIQTIFKNDKFDSDTLKHTYNFIDYHILKPETCNSIYNKPTRVQGTDEKDKSQAQKTKQAEYYLIQHEIDTFNTSADSKQTLENYATGNRKEKLIQELEKKKNAYEQEYSCPITDNTCFADKIDNEKLKVVLPTKKLRKIEKEKKASISHSLTDILYHILQPMLHHKYYPNHKTITQSMEDDITQILQTNIKKYLDEKVQTDKDDTIISIKELLLACVDDSIPKELHQIFFMLNSKEGEYKEIIAYLQSYTLMNEKSDLTERTDLQDIVRYLKVLQLTSACLPNTILQTIKKYIEPNKEIYYYDNTALNGFEEEMDTIAKSPSQQDSEPPSQQDSESPSQQNNTLDTTTNTNLIRVEIHTPKSNSSAEQRKPNTTRREPILDATELMELNPDHVESPAHAKNPTKRKYSNSEYSKEQITSLL